MLGRIVIENDDISSIELNDPNKINLVAAVSTKEVKVFNPEGNVTVIAVDIGLKYNQIRCLASRGARVKVWLSFAFSSFYNVYGLISAVYILQ